MISIYNDFTKIKSDIEYIKMNIENILNILSINKTGNNNGNNSGVISNNNTCNNNNNNNNNSNNNSNNNNNENDIQTELNLVYSFDSNINNIPKSNRFLNIMKEEEILTQSICDSLIKECLNYTLLYNWNKFEYNNSFVDIIDINKLKDFCNLLSDFLQNKIFPKIIDLYKLKNNLHICFKLIDLFIHKCNNENEPSYINIHSKKTIFSFLIPLNKNNNEILFESNQQFSLNKGDILIYCGNQKCSLKKTDDTNNYFLIGNIEFYFYK